MALTLEVYFDLAKQVNYVYCPQSQAGGFVYGHNVLYKSWITCINQVIKLVPGDVIFHIPGEFDVNPLTLTTFPKKWIKNGWRTQSGEAVKHRSDIEAFLSLAGSRDIQFHLVHAVKKRLVPFDKCSQLLGSHILPRAPEWRANLNPSPTPSFIPPTNYNIIPNYSPPLPSPPPVALPQIEPPPGLYRVPSCTVPTPSLGSPVYPYAQNSTTAYTPTLVSLPSNPFHYAGRPAPGDFSAFPQVPSLATTYGPLPPSSSTYSPVPSSTYSPVPSSTYSPLPSSTYSPLPSSTYSPVPSSPSTYSPLPSSTYSPLPSSTYSPVPSSTYSPVPSSPSTYSHPSPYVPPGNSLIDLPNSLPVPILIQRGFPRTIEEARKMLGQTLNWDDFQIEFFLALLPELQGHPDFLLLDKDQLTINPLYQDKLSPDDRKAIQAEIKRFISIVHQSSRQTRGFPSEVRLDRAYQEAIEMLQAKELSLR